MKDSYWFKHDSSASRDIKLMRIKHIYDFWGLGLYWSVIEVLREQPNYKYDSTESGLNSLSYLVFCKDQIRFNNWFNDCVKFGLFIIEENEFYSKSLIERMSVWETKKLNGSKGGRGNFTEKKANQKLNESESKANRKHKIIEDKIINNTYSELVKTWKNDFETYLQGLREARSIYFKDEKFINQQEKYNPGIDVLASIDKACINFWSTEAGWKNKKSKKIKDIDWKSTFANAISQPMNKVYLNDKK